MLLMPLIEAHVFSFSYGKPYLREHKPQLIRNPFQCGGSYKVLPAAVIMGKVTSSNYLLIGFSCFFFFFLPRQSNDVYHRWRLFGDRRELLLLPSIIKYIFGTSRAFRSSFITPCVCLSFL